MKAAGEHERHKLGHDTHTHTHTHTQKYVRDDALKGQVVPFIVQLGATTSVNLGIRTKQCNENVSPPEQDPKVLFRFSTQRKPLV